ncbi:MAG: sigma-70 family RNA polymerase sigma factor [Bacteroidia bacterium]|nr:sigma-70 family RNA polymerase sigma factor [Bacteroidia bacterium]
MSDEELIKGCIKGKENYQYETYKRFAPKMFGVCLRYCANRDEAQDVLQDGFIKVFNKIDTFKFTGSFEGWIRKIMINTALRNKYIHFRTHELNNLEFVEHPSVDEKITSDLSYSYLMKLVDELPQGYKIVFNMFAIEGYSHREISEMLNIQEATSRSQYLRARKMLRDKLEKIKRNEFKS